MGAAGDWDRFVTRCPYCERVLASKCVYVCMRVGVTDVFVYVLVPLFLLVASRTRA